MSVDHTGIHSVSPLPAVVSGIDMFTAEAPALEAMNSTAVKQTPAQVNPVFNIIPSPDRSPGAQWLQAAISHNSIMRLSEIPYEINQYAFPGRKEKGRFLRTCPSRVRVKACYLRKTSFSVAENEPVSILQK